MLKQISLKSEGVSVDEQAQHIATSYLSHIKSREIRLPDRIISLIDNYLANTSDSPLMRVEAVVRICYESYIPSSTYTRITDKNHYRLVAENVSLFSGKLPAEWSVAVEVAAWMHDIERWFTPSQNESYTGYGVVNLVELLPSDTDQPIPFKRALATLDEDFRKPVIHPWASLRLADWIMTRCQLNDRILKDRVLVLIRYHDTAPDTITQPMVAHEFPDSPIARDADRFAEFQTALKILAKADAMVFFQTPTIRLFLEDRIKKSEFGELVKRVEKNLKKTGELARVAYLAAQQILGTDSPQKPRVEEQDSGVFDSSLIEEATRNVEISQVLETAAKNLGLSAPKSKAEALT